MRLLGLALLIALSASASAQSGALGDTLGIGLGNVRAEAFALFAETDTLGAFAPEAFRLYEGLALRPRHAPEQGSASQTGMVLGGLLLGATTAGLGAVLAHRLAEDDYTAAAVVGIALFPVGVATGVYSVGYSAKNGGSFGYTLLGSAAGTALGVVLALATNEAIHAQGQGETFAVLLPYVVLMMAVPVGTVVGAVRGNRISTQAEAGPVLIPFPGRGRLPGLRLRVRL